MRWMLIQWTVVEFFEDPCAAEPSDSGVLFPAEWDVLFAMHRGVVDVGHPGLDLLGEPDSAVQVGGEHGARQSIFGVVGQAQGVRLVLGTDDGDDRTEDFVSCGWRCPSRPG